MRRCCPTSASRTEGAADTGLTARSISAVRMARVTSSPPMDTLLGAGSPGSCPNAMSCVRASCPSAASSNGTPSCRARHATARYMAPVSRQEKPSFFATAFATVDFPAPLGPSMAMIIEPTFRYRPGTGDS